MKRLNFLLVTLLVLTSCQENLLEPITPIETQKVIIPKVDPIYNVLGYGYDITGKYMDSYATTYPVIDIQAFAANEPQNIYIDPSTSKFGELILGENVYDFSSKKAVELELSGTPLLGKLFGGHIKAKYQTSSITKSKTSFASYRLIMRFKRISVNSTINNLSNYLSPQFILHLNSQSAAFIVKNYGTHVFTEVQLGSELELNYKANSNNNVDDLAAGFSIVAKGTFGLNINASSTESTSNKEQSLTYETKGGDPSQSLIGQLDLSSSSLPPITISGWENSCTPNNAVLINSGKRKLIWIWELINDPIKKQEIKIAVDDYISGRSVKIGEELFMFRRPIKFTNQFEYQFSSITPSSNEGWMQYGRVSWVFTDNSYDMGSSPLYLYHKRFYNSLYGRYLDQYKLSYSQSLYGFTKKYEVGRVYTSRINSSVIPLYEFINVDTGQYVYSTNMTQYGNGSWGSVGPDRFVLNSITGYVPNPD